MPAWPAAPLRRSPPGVSLPTIVISRRTLLMNPAGQGVLRARNNELVTWREPDLRRMRIGLARSRGVRELPEQPRDDERDLLADVDRVVADALQRARDQHHRHRPL